MNDSSGGRNARSLLKREKEYRGEGCGKIYETHDISLLSRNCSSGEMMVEWYDNVVKVLGYRRCGLLSVLLDYILSLLCHIVEKAFCWSDENEPAKRFSFFPSYIQHRSSMKIGRAHV